MQNAVHLLLNAVHWYFFCPQLVDSIKNYQCVIICLKRTSKLRQYLFFLLIFHHLNDLFLTQIENQKISIWILNLSNLLWKAKTYIIWLYYCKEENNTLYIFFNALYIYIFFSSIPSILTSNIFSSSKITLYKIVIWILWLGYYKIYISEYVFLIKKI